MIWTILFIFTFVIAALNIVKIISIMTPWSSIDLPGLFYLAITEPERWYIFYPCFFYQAWFWFKYFGIII